MTLTKNTDQGHPFELLQKLKYKPSRQTIKIKQIRNFRKNDSGHLGSMSCPTRDLLTLKSMHTCDLQMYSSEKQYIDPDWSYH